MSFLRETHISCSGCARVQLDVPVFCERFCECEPFGELCSDRGLGRSEALRFSEHLFGKRRRDDKRTIVIAKDEVSRLDRHKLDIASRKPTGTCQAFTFQRPMDRTGYMHDTSSC